MSDKISAFQFLMLRLFCVIAGLAMATYLFFLFLMNR